MAYVGTNIKIDEIKNKTTNSGTFIQTLVADILRNMPIGFNCHKTKQVSAVLDNATVDLDKYVTNPALVNEIESGYYQSGTLGGGNHFIEIQWSDDGFLGIMVQSGSRNFGKQICDYYHKAARTLNEKWYSLVPSDWNLAFLPVECEEGKQLLIG